MMANFISCDGPHGGVDIPAVAAISPGDKNPSIKMDLCLECCVKWVNEHIESDSHVPYLVMPIVTR